jgi:hypothetical protein
MAQPYKLKDEIERFILEKKKAEPKFSCRSLVSLIKERFGVDLSKSTINTIIKESKLSSKVGRPRIREKEAPQSLPAETVPAAVSSISPVLVVKESIVQQTPVDAEIRPIVEPIFEAVNFVSGPLEVSKLEEIKPPAALDKPQTIEIKTITEQSADIENGGAIFLLMVDYKLGLTDFLAQKILPYMADLSPDIIRLFIQSRVYGQIIKGEDSLGKFLGKKVSGEYLPFYYEQLAKIPLNQLSQDFISQGIERNINEINDLYKECLLRLNSQAQELFLPPVYKFLDFPAMCERFYSLLARIERKDTIITVGFFYPKKFKAIADIVWQEDFKSAVSKLNKERIFTPEGKLFRFEEVLAPYQ